MEDTESSLSAPQREQLLKDLRERSFPLRNEDLQEEEGKAEEWDDLVGAWKVAQEAQTELDRMKEALRALQALTDSRWDSTLSIARRVFPSDAMEEEPIFKSVSFGDWLAVPGVGYGRFISRLAGQGEEDVMILAMCRPTQLIPCFRTTRSLTYRAECSPYCECYRKVFPLSSIKPVSDLADVVRLEQERVDNLVTYNTSFFSSLLFLFLFLRLTSATRITFGCNKSNQHARI